MSAQLDNPETLVLLPCPFCGSADIDAHGWASERATGPACDDCGASAGGVSAAHADNVAAWNQRSTPGDAEAVSATTAELIRQIRERDAKGRAKYGETLDRGDLSHNDWLQHMAEELMDAAGYALAAKRAISTPPVVDGEVKEWIKVKRDLLSARMAAGGFHAQEALDMTMLSRLESALGTGTTAPDVGEAMVELADALELPEGYRVTQELPGVWTYSHVQDGSTMVCNVSWNHPALAACAAWHDTQRVIDDAMVDRAFEAYQSVWRTHEKRTDDKPLPIRKLLRAALTAALGKGEKA